MSRRSLVIARRRQQVANLYLQGWPQAEIADHLQIAQSTISNDLKRIQKEWRRFDDPRLRHVAERSSYEKLDRLERESWAAWERSQKPVAAGAGQRGRLGAERRSADPQSGG